ncbi:MAG: CapA family protein, partial [Clostridiales bacterium]|nr:CapA family protein [Clostridiales bacterium]
LFENVSDEILAADLAIVNQEVILGGTKLGLSGYPAFNGAFEVGDALVNAGFDVVLHATNHALDKGKKGLLNCLDFWSQTYPDMKIVGIYDSQEASENICIYEQNEISVAILNYTYGTNGISMPADMPFSVNLLSEEKVIRDIKKAEEMADFTIVCPHWGTEYSHEVSQFQEKWAGLFLENGVDLVLGTHPHVIEPVEWLEDEKGNKMLVYYSLGNFINSTSGRGSKVADRMVGLMAQITLMQNNSGEVMIKEYDAIPLVTQMLTGQGQITTYQLSEYTEELAAQNEILERDPAFSIEYCKKLCETVLGKLYNSQ